MDLKTILIELKQGNNSNFSILYNQTKNGVYFTILSIIRNHEHALDLLQDTYIAFLKNVVNIDENKNPLAYLQTIARNLTINAYNKKKRSVTSDEYVEAYPDRDESDFLSNKRVTDILNLLDDDIEREVVVHHVILEEKFKDIAKIINKPLGTVLWIYNKAIKKLKERVVMYED